MGDKNILLLLDRMEFCALNSTVLSYVKNMDRNKFHFDILVAANQLGSMEKQFSNEGCNVFCLCASTSDRKFKTKFAEFIQKRNKYDVVHSFLKNGMVALAVAKENEIPVRIINCSENDVAHNRKNNKNDEITHIVTTGNNNQSDNTAASGKKNADTNEINLDNNGSKSVNREISGVDHVNTNAAVTNEIDEGNEGIMVPNENKEEIVSVNKAVVTQSSAAIPIVPLYLAILFKVMKEQKVQEGCIEQMYRMIHDRLCNGGAVVTDENRLIRMDDWEMEPKVQEAVVDYMHMSTVQERAIFYILRYSRRNRRQRHFIMI